jgi:hypothetical protein
VSFMPLKIRSISVFIAGIDSMSNAIDVSCVESEFIYYLKRSISSVTTVIRALI